MNRFIKAAKKPAKAKEKPEKLSKWQERFENARSYYANDVSIMKKDMEYYEGSRTVYNKENQTSKRASNVRNIVYELIETQVDSSIPLPKITPVHEEDEEKAKLIEKILTNEIKKLKLHNVNDIQERVVPVTGGSFFHVEWDETKSTHCTIGDLSITNRQPQFVVPQPGLYDIDDMDYVFVYFNMTRDYIKRKYGVSVEDASNNIIPDTENNSVGSSTDLLTVVVAYYRNKNGGIGKYTWTDDYVLEDYEDYQARQLDHCVKCGAVMDENGVCPECGCKKSEKRSEDYEELADTITISDGQKINPEDMGDSEMYTDENGMPMVDEQGNTLSVKTVKKKIPYYKPNVMPIIPRINVTRDRHFIGYSDVEAIKDQQDAIKKYGTKIDEKLLKGGSYITLPRSVAVETNGEDLNILRLNTPADKALIDVYNLQPNVSYDQQALNDNYNYAKSTLGITDSYQGKYDSSATSGTAKQYSINQAAGRLESKRIMKNEAWSKLYEIMFKFLLAYSDEPIEISSDGSDGKMEFAHFDRYEFLKIDASGEFYWDDEFIFETDPTSTIMANREAMWNANDMKLQSGAFGQIGDLETARLYWTLQAKHSYPNANEILRMIDQRIAEKQQMEQQMAQVIPGGGNNDLSAMQNGNANSGQPLQTQ